VTHFHDRLVKGSDWKEKIVTVLAILVGVGGFIFLTYLSTTH